MAPLPRLRIKCHDADTARSSEHTNSHLRSAMARDIQRSARRAAKRTECKQRRIPDAQRVFSGSQIAVTADVGHRLVDSQRHAPRAVIEELLRRQRPGDAVTTGALPPAVAAA